MAKKRKLKICMATAEFAPLAKTGGLADVSAALSAYLDGAGHDVRLLMPYYSTLNSDKLEIETVDGLRNLTVAVGPWNIEYSIDRARLPGTRMSIYLLRCPALYDRGSLYTSAADEHLRFILLARGAIEMCQHMRFAPDIFHCHDWHAALVPLFLRSVYAWDQLFANTKCVLTIHNIGYQGIFSADILDDLNLQNNAHLLHQEDLSRGRINFLKSGFLYADMLTTVSPTYAKEIQGAEYGMGLDDILRNRKESLIGILNGVDSSEWDPETDPLIPQNYSRQEPGGKKVCKATLLKEMGLETSAERPLIGIVSRLVSQKGFDLLERVLPAMMSERDFALAVLGSGEQRYEDFFEAAQQRWRGRISFYRGYSEKLAHWIEAGSDIFLMPSRYEPCGLNQMYSLKYGTVPVVRETGGLADSVQQIDPGQRTGTGILFRNYDETGLTWAINNALNLFNDKPLWDEIVQNGMAMDFSWQRQGEQYVTIFNQLTGK